MLQAYSARTDRSFQARCATTSSSAQTTHPPSGNSTHPDILQVTPRTWGVRTGLKRGNKFNYSSCKNNYRRFYFLFIFRSCLLLQCKTGKNIFVEYIKFNLSLHREWGLGKYAILVNFRWMLESFRRNDNFVFNYFFSSS